MTAALDRVLQLEPAIGQSGSDELGVVLDLELVLLAALCCDVGVELLPHQRARRARGHDCLCAALAGLGDVVLVDLLEEVPLARDLHRDATASLVLAHVGEFVARIGEQARGCLGDVLLDEARGAAREVHDRTLVLDERLDVLGNPVGAVLGLAGPDVLLAAKRRRHHLERREGAALLLVDELAAHLHPVVLDGKLQLAAGVADLARGADEHRVDRLAVPLLATRHDLTDVGVLAARRLALPSATGVLLARRHAVAAARAGVRHERDVTGDAVHVAGQVARAARRLGGVGDRSDDGLERVGRAHDEVDHAAAVDLAGVHDAGRVDLGLVGLERGELVGTENARGLSAEVQAGRVRGATVCLGDLDDRQRQGEREVEREASARREG